MNRAIAWVIAGGVLLSAAAAFAIAAPERDSGPVFIEGSRPVSEEQVRQKLVSDGWTGFKSYGAGGLSWQWAQRKDEPKPSLSIR
jgi:hypothetical protein